MRNNRKWPFWLVLAVIAGLGALWAGRDTFQYGSKQGSTAAAAPTETAATGGIGCIGRFTTEEPIVRVAAAYFESRPSVVSRLFVREGDWVRAGQTVAWLDGKDLLEAARVKAVAELERAQRTAAQVRATAKPAEISAQQALISRLEAAQKLAQIEFQRDERLLASRDIPAGRMDRSTNALEASNQAVVEAKHLLASMTEVRPEDIAVADAQVRVAQATIEEIDSRLKASTVLAPVAGRVIQIHVHPGEKADQTAILDLGDTRHMAVEAEVYAADVGSVRVGQRATIQPEGSSTVKLQGEVISVGVRVRKPAVLSNDPAAFSDAHVVPVRIRVEGCGDGLCPIDGRVRVVIQPGS